MNNEDINIINNVDADTLKKRLNETKKKVSNDRKEKNKKRIIIISIIASALLLIGAIVLFFYYRSLESYKFNAANEYNLYQYFQGVKVEYKGKVSIKKDGKEIKMSQNTGIDNIEDAPMYFKDNENQVFFAKNMSLVIPRIKNQNYKINYFSKIINEDDSVYLINKYDKKMYLEESFLYDGNNLYFFIYDTTLTIDKKEYKLSKLSYAIVNYKGQIEIYDKKSDKYTIIDEHNDDVIANIGEYKLNLSTDILSYKDDSRLLIKSVDSLPNYEEVKNQ